MKSLGFILIITIFLAGCSTELSIEEQKKQCLQDGNKFLIEKILNYRTGEIELKGRCS